MDAEAQNPLIRRVLDFWFGPDGRGGEEHRDIWFEPTPEFDEQINRLFKQDCDKAARGEMDGLMDTADGCLTLVILTDQFPRNLYRGTDRAFSCDAKAIAVARHAVEKGFDRELEPAQRMFLYLPFEHSEDLKDQNRSVELIQLLGNAQWLDYAVQHRDIIAEFGRFPHRNEILGRDSTPAEIEFLRKPGSSF